MPIIPSRDMIDTGWTDFGEGDRAGGGPKLGGWSSLIGIITAIVGNILIALALNVQRYSHVQLHRKQIEVRGRAKEAMKRIQNGSTGYGTTDAVVRSPGRNEDGATDAQEDRTLSHSVQPSGSGWTETSNEDKITSTYLKSPSWWLGQVLMTVGEMGNFLAYGFAPASIVSPLGVFALISNCVIAPLFFGEIFRARDFWGVLIAIAGAVTVVLSAKQEETKLEPHDVWKAITTLEFEVYMAVTITLIIILMWASPKYGNRTILIDIGLVGLFGGYTALTTKGVSSMLSATLWRAFATPVTYVLVVILLGTAVMQVRYVNKALQRFDSTQVIPVQFVLFTLSVIIGSAVLYRDFESVSREQGIKFIGGCILTFFGVFLITSGRPQHEDDELSDDERVEETIGLRDASDAQGGKSVDEEQEPESSRRGSRASRVGFADLLRPSTGRHDSGVPSQRNRDASVSASRSPLPAESSPLLANPWDTSLALSPHPGLPPTFSDDNVDTIHSTTSVNNERIPSSQSLPTTAAGPPSPHETRTPRPSFSSTRPHSQHLSSTIISPSPLSSTVSAVVSDALLRGEDSPLPRRKSMRRMRTSLRSSLFVPQGEDDENDAFLRTNEPEPIRATTEPYLGEPRSLKGRARSFSTSLGQFFGKKRRRRVTNPESCLGQDSQSSGFTDGSGSGSGHGET